MYHIAPEYGPPARSATAQDVPWLVAVIDIVANRFRSLDTPPLRAKKLRRALKMLYGFRMIGRSATYL